MAAEIVNLRQARKSKARATKEARAEENRRVFGQSLVERRHRKAVDDLEKRKLFGLRRERPQPTVSTRNEDGNSSK